MSTLEHNRFDSHRLTTSWAQGADELGRFPRNAELGLFQDPANEPLR